MTLSRCNDALRSAMKLAAEGAPDRGLAMLEELLEKEVLHIDPSRGHTLALIARSAAVLAQRLSDNTKAVAMYEQALALEPDDAMTHLALAQLHKRNGHAQLAAVSFDRFAELAATSTDPNLLALLRKASEPD